jgi:microcin C transport system substrate-binding protein
MLRLARPVACLVACVTLVACRGMGSKEGAPRPEQNPAMPPAHASPAAPAHDVNIPMVTYAWDPQAGDPSVPAELGGPGFSGVGWETRMTYPAHGDARAVKGGSMTIFTPDWPATLRMIGKDWNSTVNFAMKQLCYESLLALHPATQEWTPGLATHWQVSEDKTTYRYRINPKARFWDGTEVTAQDVVASFKLLMDPTLLEPSSTMTFAKFHDPVALSKYVVEVKVKEPNWRNFLYFSDGALAIFPAKDISMGGKAYLEKYQFAFHPGTGGYWVRPEDVRMGESVTLRRRTDYWDEGNPAGVGLGNIDAITWVVVKDPALAFEKVKKGELDYYQIPKAQWWAEELPKVDVVQRGLLVRRKFYTHAPHGANGLAINMARPPLDDVRVRKALCHLLDRPTMIEKLYFDEYAPLKSYYPGGEYENPDNVMVSYDEVAAVELLEQAGWTTVGEDGYRVKDGKVLGFTVQYGTPLSERSLTIYQEACKRAGIRLELQLLTPASRWKNIREKEYELSDQPWSGLFYPNPETSFHGRLAKEKDNNNVTGFSDPRVDELCARYDKSYDHAERVAIIRELDGIVFAAHPYVLEWYNPAQRVVYWNKFSMPPWGSARTADSDELFFNWWVDPEKEKALQAAKADPTMRLETPPVDLRFWDAWAAARERATRVAGQ